MFPDRKHRTIFDSILFGKFPDTCCSDVLIFFVSLKLLSHRLYLYRHYDTLPVQYAHDNNEQYPNLIESKLFFCESHSTIVHPDLSLVAAAANSADTPTPNVGKFHIRYHLYQEAYTWRRDRGKQPTLHCDACNPTVAVSIVGLPHWVEQTLTYSKLKFICAANVRVSLAFWYRYLLIRVI